ncbi:cytidine deaminase [Ponticaulis sp.]|uniref:cytidine deaminase n=1 Tax=Ponticaulis sp. TaxID=2020902 RepID=UPI000B6FE00E|nr:cytidine deaminase [Ponticaulis sp.]MAP95159.1 cytidine deaminase [Ponticaulis sp.]HBH91520.1 cytidine deaminase [Hyphomonadaceae bacterium]HBJ93369.1 cytidine deaminase [Hyphomonadaceae bacterium]
MVAKSENFKRLRQAAIAARNSSHSPYSKFSVGAALLSAEGSVHVGTNVENASFPEGSCAETSCISSMVLSGEKDIAEIVIVGGPHNQEASFCAPCGGCRQRIGEFANPKTTVHFSINGSEFQSVLFAELVPFFFKSQSD